MLVWIFLGYPVSTETSSSEFNERSLLQFLQAHGISTNDAWLWGHPSLRKHDQTGRYRFRRIWQVGNHMLIMHVRYFSPQYFILKWQMLAWICMMIDVHSSFYFLAILSWKLHIRNSGGQVWHSDFWALVHQTIYSKFYWYLSGLLNHLSFTQKKYIILNIMRVGQKMRLPSRQLLVANKNYWSGWNFCWTTELPLMSCPATICGCDSLFYSPHPSPLFWRIIGRASTR